MNAGLDNSCHTSLETTLLKCNFAFALLTIHQRFMSHFSANDVRKTRKAKQKHIQTFETVKFYLFS